MIYLYPRIILLEISTFVRWQESFHEKIQREFDLTCKICDTMFEIANKLRGQQIGRRFDIILGTE